MYPIQKNELLNFEYFEKYIKENKINVINLTVSLFNKLIEYNPKIFDETRVVLIGGEAVLPKTVNILRHTSPHVEIINVYGPTENSDLSSCHIIKKDYKNAVPIGIPVSNSTCYVLDKNQNPLPIRIPGEIFVGGDGVALGYLNNEALTMEKFVTNKFGEGTLYKTGDLGYWEEDGTLQFVSRIDNQIKIRGFRIELKEIESKILEFGNIKECAVIVSQKNEGASLVACIVEKNKISTEKLDLYLKSSLPFYMIPSKYICVNSLPLNINGKLDINTLLKNVSYIKDELITPESEVEKILVNICKETLDIENIGINQNFFEIGGDSLSAIRLLNLINSEFNIQIPMKKLFEMSTLEDLAIYIENNSLEKTMINKVDTETKSENYPVSSAQKRIYFASSVDGKDSILYNISGGLILDSIPNITKLENAFNKLIKRQSSLRTYFEIENNKLVQKVKDKINFNLDIDNNIVLEKNLESEFKKFVKPFDLSITPLIRAKLQYLQNQKAILMIDMHHIISDGTSLSILLNELCKIYNGEELPEIKIEYKDYAIWENNKIKNKELEKAEEYWINQFENDIPVLNLPTNYPRSAIQSFEGNKIYTNINKEITNKINDLSNKLKITPYMLLLSCYYILLYKYSFQNDIVIGSPILNRIEPEFYNIVGMFVNSLPMRTNIDSSLSFETFVNKVKEMCLKSYKYQDYPFDELVNKLNIKRDTSRNPLFDTMFIYQNNGYVPATFKGINSKYYIPDTKISKFDLSLEIIPNKTEFNISFEYCTKLFDKEFIENLSNHYINIIKAVLENINTKIADIDMLSSTEKNKILYEFNDTKMDYPKDKTIVQLFEEQVEKTPDNIAVVFENQKLTYKELNEKANSLAHYLRETKRIERNNIVGIMVNRSLEMIISILAVLKSGACYIPIDPEYPQERIEYMLKDSKSKLLLTFKNLDQKLNFTNKIFVELSNSIYNGNIYNLENINMPVDLSYVIYTSGSTGKPKGVMLTHKNIVNFIYSIMEKIKLPPDSTIVSITTISFDIFVLESLLPLLNGMEIIIATEEAQTDGKIFNNLCINNNVNIIQTTPSRLETFLYDDNNIDFIKKVKYLLIGGEPFPENLLKKLHCIYDGKIYNMYGPTETSVWSSVEDLSNDTSINIGRPIGNTQMYILDKNKLPVPTNVSGELFISGDGLAKGYLNNNDLTNKTFVTNPFVTNTKMYKTGDLCKFLPDGKIKYLQRVDNQIKIRGLRIELEEIENKILSYPNIKKVCVIKQTINNRDFISAYYTSSKRINISEIRNYLSAFLPKYMVPSYFTVLSDFPYTPNGKIDKKSLPLPKEILSSDNTKEYSAPKTDLEKKFVNVWESILNIKPIGITDNFFELGGDSMLAMNLNIELKKITDSISYADIFKYPTINELIKKTKSKNEDYDFNYMEKNYDKYKDILALNLKVPRIFNVKYKSAGNILLTGATGFLGMHILDNFIKNEKGNIYCLIREEEGLTAQSKLYQKLNYYFGNKYNDLIGKRIFAVTGNIVSPAFGLNQEDLLNLSNNIDLVINAAARVTHYGNYADGKSLYCFE